MKIRKNLPFIIVMAVFMIACAVITIFTIDSQPQYVKLIPGEVTAGVTDESAVKINIININTAGSEELQTLPGIGEVIAGRIIEYRDNHGGFLNIEEIMEVSGIGEKMFENIKDYICIE